MRFTPDGRRLATAGFDKTVRIWDVASGEMLLTLRGHKDKLFRLAFSADGTSLFSESPGNGIIVWHAPRE